MTDRFYLPGPWTGSALGFPDEEFHHLARVLRKQVGDQVEIFDGRGKRATATIMAINKKQALVQVQGEIVESCPSSRILELAVSPPKGDRFKWLVEKCTELGVDRLLPLKTSRSVVDPRESKLQKLDQTVISACKQCRRDRLLEITPSIELMELFPRFRETVTIFGDQGGRRLTEVLQDVSQDSLTNQPGSGVLIIVGPEGGFSAEEITHLQNHGAQAVAIGTNILRIETAAIALAAACMA